MPLTDRTIRQVTALIMTHNRKEELVICLDSLRMQNFPSLQVMVVDNNSIDGTTTMIREDYGWVDYIELDENRGVTARNIGAREAEGDLIISLDDDSKLPSSTSVSRIVRKFEKDPDLGAAGFRLIDEGGQEDSWFTWKKNGNLRKGFKSPTFIGCGAAIRPEMFDRVDGFWDPYFMHLEERDFALRIWNSGSEVRYFPTISIIHRSRQARREHSRFIYFVTRNTFWYIWRNFPTVPAFFRTVVEVFKLGVMALRKGGFGLYLKGLWDVRTNFREALRTRDPVDPQIIGLFSGQFEEDRRR